jgi:hypothetical protein
MPTVKLTWKPAIEHSKLSAQEQNELPESLFTLPQKRKESLTVARHVRNAMARFDQVEGVSDDERDLAWNNIRAAAADYYGVEIQEHTWHDLCCKPHQESCLVKD